MLALLVVQRGGAFGAGEKAAGARSRARARTTRRGRQADADKAPRRRCRRSCSRRWTEGGAGHRGAARGDQADRGLPARNPRLGGYRAKEQAEALYKLAELYWEESKEVYLEKMGRYQAAVTACHDDRGAVPEGPAPAAHRRSAQAQAVYRPADRRVPEVPQDRHGHLPLRVLAARPGEDRRVDQVLPDHPRQVPALPLHRRRLDGDRRVPLLRAAGLPELARGVREGPQAPEVDSSTTWRCSRPPGATGSWATPPRARSGSRTCSIWPRRRPAAPRREQKRAEELQGAGARLPGRAVHRRRHQDARATPSSSWPRSAASSTRARS